MAAGGFKLAIALTAGLSMIALADFGQAQPPASAPSRISFEQDAHPPAPDYADPASWAALPDRPNLSAEIPAGEATPPAASARADVFYVQPTTFRSTGPWNQNVADKETNTWTDVSVVARQATIFNACCRVYMPRYRQASTGASLTKGSSGLKAYDLAYEDVKRAFEYYLAHDNHGRPFILAGHSQGALHIYQLIEDEIDGKPVQKQLVAAYAIGVPIAEGAFGRRYKSVRACLKPRQTGCIVSWNSYMSDADATLYLKLSQGPYVERFGDVPGKTPLCVNPLTFDADRPAATAAANTGSLAWPPTPGPLTPLAAHAVSAECRNGVLAVTPSPTSTFKPFALPGGSLHMQDTDLFYQAMRENAVTRVNSYFAERR